MPTSAGQSAQRTPGVHTIVIDPGHGGVETGAIGPGGVQEKQLTLELARELAGKLGRLGVQTLLTRGDDTLVPLDNRPALANQNRADLFISIHLNSSLGAGAYGTETYFLSPQASIRAPPARPPPRTRRRRRVGPLRVGRARRRRPSSRTSTSSSGTSPRAGISRRASASPT